MNLEQSFLIFFNIDITIFKTKKYTRFLNILSRINKTFRIFIIVKKLNDFDIYLNKFYIQIDQNLNINVIFIKLMRLLNIIIHFLSNIEFKKLFMRIIDYRNIIFEY